MLSRWRMTFLVLKFSLIGPSWQHFGTNLVVNVTSVALSSLCPSVDVGAVRCGRTVTYITHAGCHWPLMDLSDLRAAFTSTVPTCSLIITAGMKQTEERSGVSTKILKCRDVSGCKRRYFFLLHLCFMSNQGSTANEKQQSKLLFSLPLISQDTVFLLSRLASLPETRFQQTLTN